MRINNTNGNYIKCSPLDFQRVKAEFFEHCGTDLKKSEILVLDEPLPIGSVLEDYVNATYTALGLSTAEGWSVSADDQNWLTDAKQFRFFLPIEIIADAAKDDPDLQTLTNAIVAEAEQDENMKIVRTSKYRCIYVNSFPEENQAILQKYMDAEFPVVWMEQKQN